MNLETEAYDKGVTAARNNCPVWENPYAVGSGLKHLFHAWFAGWCFGMQQTAPDRGRPSNGQQ